MDPTLIAVAQLAITVAEPDANRRAAADAVAEAAAAGARLVVLPELCDSGYVFDAADPAAEARGLAAPAADSTTLRQWHELAARHRLVIVGGFCELGADGRLYNSAALVDASGTRAVYRKAHLWDSEKLVFTPGDAALPTVDTEVGRVAVMVCYDLEFPEWTRLAALDGADLIAAPVNWPGYSWPEGERPAEVVKAQAAAAANGVFVAVADRCRTERGVSWISGSLIASPEGYTLAGPVLADRPAVLTAACDLPRARDKHVSGRNDLLADRRPELYAWAPDKRVAAATAHWAARFVANGTSYPDFQATMARITRWDDWCREWGRTARHYEQLAEGAEAAGRTVTAGEAWRRAALCWHWGKFVFTDHPEEQRAAHERTVACFRRGAGTLSPPAEPVRVPYAGSTLAAYLRIPPGEPGPVVIMIPGLDSVKEELQATAEYMLRRGLAVIAIDGPGQGESRVRVPDRAGLRTGGHGRGRLPEGPRRPRPGPAGRIRREPGRLLRRPFGRLRAAGAGRGGPGRPLPVGPGLGRAAQPDQDHLPGPVGRGQPGAGPRAGRGPDPGGCRRADYLPAPRGAWRPGPPDPGVPRRAAGPRGPGRRADAVPGRQPRRHQPRVRVPGRDGRLARRPPDLAGGVRTPCPLGGQ